MQKSKLIGSLAQVAILVAFGFMSWACATQKPVINSNVITRTDTDPCVGEGYVFVGTFDSEAEAKSAANRMGFSEYCYSDNQCYGVK